MGYAISFVVVLLAIVAAVPKTDLKWAPPMIAALAVLALCVVVTVTLLFKLLSWLL